MDRDETIVLCNSFGRLRMKIVFSNFSSWPSKQKLILIYFLIYMFGRSSEKLQNNFQSRSFENYYTQSQPIVYCLISLDLG